MYGVAIRHDSLVCLRSSLKLLRGVLCAVGDSARTVIARCILAALASVTTCQDYARAEPLLAGDLAPLNNPDGELNAADALILQRIVMGALTPTQTQLRVGDVAPLGAPDGELNAGDLVVLMRAINGAITLPDVYVGPDAPVLDAPISPTTANPYAISGTAEPATEVRIYVNGALANFGHSGADGSFAFTVTLSDGVNLIHATAYSGGMASTPSNVVSVDYQNSIDRNQTDTVITQDTVWTPGTGNQPYVIEGSLTVVNGATLTILPGTVLSLGFGSALEIHGSVQLVGSPDQPILFTSDSPSAQAGDWTGIRIHADASNVEIRHTHIAWADYGIYDFGATNVTIAENLIENLKYGGIYLASGATALIEANTISVSGFQSTYNYQKGNGIEMVSASPMIKGNVISGHGGGILVKSASNPLITDQNSVTGNDTGIVLEGDYWSSSNNPNPVITGNSIYLNTQYNLMTDGYVDPVDPFGFVELEYDFSGNWWGSADPSAIAEKIYDFKNTRGSYTPVVKLVPFLGSENGAPVAGNFLNGLYPDNLSLSSTQPYIVAGSFVIGGNAALTVLEGVRFEFAKTTSLVALGPVNIIGQPSSPVVFTSYETTKSPADWLGLSLFGPASVVSFAQIDYARDAVQIQGANTSVSNSVIQDFLVSGIDLEMQDSISITNCQIIGQLRQGTGIIVASSEALIENNTVQNTDIGMSLRYSPTVRGNTISNNNRGISLMRQNANELPSNPVVESNRITDNTYGVYIDAYGSLTGDPSPAIHENEIYSNTTFSVYIKDYHPTAFVDATRNWWGTEDENAILASLNSPQIMYSPYKDSTGLAVYSQRYSGVLSTDVDIAPGEVRQVDTTVIVPPGTTLTLGPNTRLEFAPGAALVVNGDVVVESDGSNRPVLSSSVSQPQWNDYWGGLIINKAGIDLHDLVVEHATVGAKVYADNVTLRDSTFSGCRDSCVSFQGLSTKKIVAMAERLTVDVSSPSSTATGMEFIHTNGRVAGSVVRNAYKGIASLGLSGLRIEKNTIESNSRGLYVTSGYAGYQYSPAKPVTQDNNIVNNAVRGYETTAYSLSPTTVLDATNNWWGSDQESAIQAAIWDETDATSSYPRVSYLPFRTSAVAMPPRLNPIPATSSTATLVVAGQAAPSATVSYYVNGVVAASVAADGAGDFSAPIPLGQGENIIYAIDTSGAAPSYPSRSYTVNYDNVAPVISLTTPTDGLLTNQYAITFTGSLSEPATLTIGGNTVALDANNAFNHGPVYLSEGANAIELVATDVAGNVTTQTVNLTLDSTPPSDPVPALIDFDSSSGSQSLVSGGAGSVQAGAVITLVNVRTGQTSRTTAATDGSFALSVGSAPGDDLALISADDSGNQSAWLDHTVTGTAPTLALVIASPVNNATVPGDTVHVVGTITGPANTGIVVNGVVANIEGGQFVATDVPVVAGGPTTLTVTVTDPDGATVTESIVINGAAGPPVELSVTPDHGLSPLPVTFNLERVSPFEIGSVEIDLDGDGVYDLTGSDIAFTQGLDAQGNNVVVSAAASHTYLSPGLYTVRVRVQGAGANSGVSYVLDHPVLVQDAIGAGSNLRRIYQRMLGNLATGNPAGALSALSQTMRDKFTTLFTDPAIDFSLLVPELGEIVGGGISGDVGFLVVKRNDAGQDLYHSVYFNRGPDGIWRIGEM